MVKDVKAAYSISIVHPEYSHAFKLGSHKVLALTETRKNEPFVINNFDLQHYTKFMRTLLQKFGMRKPSALFLLLAFATIMSSCKKDNAETPEELEQPRVVFAYEVDCNYCNISYTNEVNQTIFISNNVGKWSYQIDKEISFDLKLTVATVNAGYQTIQAYVLKNDEVVFGNSGYNRADISYNTASAKGTSSFGDYSSTRPSTGNGSGGSTAPTSSVCGAKNKTGGYCKRVVVGGGRCWQHR